MDYVTLVSEPNSEQTQGRRIKILLLKQMLQRLQIFIAQQAGNTSENFQNWIRQIDYSLYQANQTSKKVSNNLLKSI